MKGKPVPVAAIFHELTCLRLEHFPDGTWEIDRDGHCVGSWEANEREVCLEMFMSLAAVETDAWPVRWLATDVAGQTGVEETRPA